MHLRNKRVLSVVSLITVALLALAGAGCSAAGGTELSSMTSDVRPEEPGIDLGNIDETLEGFGEDIQQFFGDFLEGIDLSDLPEDLGEAIPGLGSASPECAELLREYTTLFIDASMGAPTEDVEADAAEIRKALPEDLHDEFDIMISAAIEVAESDELGGGELFTPEYIEADRTITEYLVGSCGSGTSD